MAMTRRIVLHGHRGARGLHPENTLAGFAGALAIGVDVLELDVAMTADDVVVVTHDPRLNPDLTRDRDGAWLTAPGATIRSLRAVELAAYDVGRIRPGTAYAAAYPEQVPQDGATIPTFAAALRIDPEVRFNVELKSFPWQPGLAADGVTMAEAVVAVAEAQGAVGRLIVQSFDWRGPRRLRRRRDIEAGLADPPGVAGRGADLVGRAAPRGLRRLGARAPWRPRAAPPGDPTTPTSRRRRSPKPTLGPPRRAVDGEPAGGHAPADPLGRRWTDHRSARPRARRAGRGRPHTAAIMAG